MRCRGCSTLLALLGHLPPAMLWIKGGKMWQVRSISLNISERLCWFAKP